VSNNKQNDAIPVVEGSGNVFADLGLPDAADLLFKAELARQLCNRIKKLRLTGAQAAKQLGIKKPEVANLINGRYTSLSTDHMMALLNALAVDVEIVLRPQRQTPGQRGTIRVLEAVG